MKKRVSTRVAKDWFFILGYIGLWYAGVAIVVNIALKIVSTFNLPGFNGNELFQSASAMSYIFMLVIGIVMPLMYQKYYVSLGVTRKQTSQGMLLAVLVLAFFMALVHAGIYLVSSLPSGSLINPSMIPLQFLRDIFLFVFYYLLGWLICWGFTVGRFATAALSILVGAVCVNGVARLLGDPIVVMGAESGLLPEFAIIGVIVLVTGALAFALLQLIQRMPLKAS